MQAGILSYGAYIPRRRLARQLVADANGWFNPALRAQAGAGERAVCNWDEDAVTMAVDAARDCLGNLERGTVRRIHLASTSFPFDDRLNAGIVAEALRLGPELSALDVGCSQRAATSGLLAALAASQDGATLFATAERRRARAASALEMSSGDGAAALLLGTGPVIARLVASHSRTTDFVDHYRGQGVPFDYPWEERWIRDEGHLKITGDALAALFTASGVDPQSVDHFCVPFGQTSLASLLARRSRIPGNAIRDNLQATCGEVGAAHPLVMLVDALAVAKPGERIVVLGFGQGCDALLFEVTPSIRDLPSRIGVAGHLRRRTTESVYTRHLAFNNLITMERGMRSELDKQTPLSALYRKRSMILGLVGGRCERCGTRQFPRTNVCVAPTCRARHSQAEAPFADTPGVVRSLTADLLTYCPDPPAICGLVQFEGGGRLIMDFTDCAEHECGVGTRMRMVFRIKEHDTTRGFVRYFWKATPAAGSGED